MPISITISATTVAWYAAIISTFLLVIQILNFLRDRINVVVEVKPNIRVYGPGEFKEDVDYINITVKNKGKRPVTIQSVGFVTKKKKNKDGLLTDSFTQRPRELSDGKSTDYLVEQSLIDFDEIKYFVAYDQAGRKFKGKISKRW